jgi:Protein of unknown function (DUF3179)
MSTPLPIGKHALERCASLTVPASISDLRRARWWSASPLRVSHELILCRPCKKQSPIIDVIGSTPIVIVLGDDGRSVRAFERTVDGRRLEFFLKTGQGTDTAHVALQLVDAETNSTWDFEGRATAGSLAGRELKKVFVLEDYWFDWRNYHPDTSIYSIGSQ